MRPGRRYRGLFFDSDGDLLVHSYLERDKRKPKELRVATGTCIIIRVQILQGGKGERLIYPSIWHEEKGKEEGHRLAFDVQTMVTSSSDSEGYADQTSIH